MNLNKTNFNFKRFAILSISSAILIACSTTKQYAQPEVKNTKDNDNIDSIRDQYYDESYLRYADYIYSPNIHTVTADVMGEQMTFPIISLSQTIDEVILFAFDDFNAESTPYAYTVIHCNSNWEPSDLLPNDYISGFMQASVIDYEFSFNTIQRYINHQIVIPSEDFRITQSGNYILKVFPESDPNKAIFTKRFYVLDQQVGIDATVARTANVQDREYMQEIDFKINLNNKGFSNPFANIKPVILQNERFDNRCEGLKPVFIKDQLLVYDYNSTNVFEGGNEFRFFDIRSVRFKSDRIYNMVTTETSHNIMLVPDEKRTYKQYFTLQDINGKHFISVQEGNDNSLESDYANVQFFLKYPKAISTGNLYVFGKLSDWEFKEEYKLKYNEELGAYSTSVLLKQGFYNYAYAFRSDKDEKGNISKIEGSHFATENKYQILIYYRDPSLNFDKLIGYHTVTSR